MEFKKLHKQFTQGVNWNAFLFFIQKTLSISLTILLFKTLSSKNFSIWANTNSAIFLLLLWLDFGLKKSIPRFAPEFSKNGNSYQFIQSIILFKLSTLFIAAPLFFFTARWYINNSDFTNLLLLASVLFLAEGIVTVFRLIFHSYFLQKIFNVLVSLVLTIQMGVNLILIWLHPIKGELLYYIFLTKIISAIAIIASSYLMTYKIKTKIKAKKRIKTYRRLIKHSIIMWSTSSIKSLTERNFLQPMFTIILGPGPANLFKVANDGALFFYRMVIKTIGTTDTSLLSYVETDIKNKKFLPIAFNKLTTKITSLCVPLLGLILAFACQSTFAKATEHICLGLCYNTYGFQLFIILTIFYLTQTLFSPYERILEVKRKYWTLLFAYIPYVLMAITLLIINAYKLIPLFGLIGIICAVHFVRMVSMIIMIYYAKTKYDLKFPILYSITLFVVSFLGGFAALLLLKFL